MEETASRTSWKNHPIDQPKRIEIDLFLTNKQFSKLVKGLIPHEMEDKWFIFYENEWLYFHRSWTGYGLYKAQLTKEIDGYSIREFWAERNKEKYGNENDSHDSEVFTFLIARGLLGIDVRGLYSRRNVQSGDDAIRGWGDFGNLLFTNKGVDYCDEIKSVLFGVAVGDALGVPVEFMSRETIRRNPVADMIGFGTYNLPAGTWSDDSSLTFCLAEALIGGFQLDAIGQNFVGWCNDNYWTPHGKVFDIGNGTRYAISRIANGEKPEFSGAVDESNNGNGSLMRILPLLFYMIDKPIHERFEIVKKVSSITHGHIRSIIACFYYLEFAKLIFEGNDKFETYTSLQTALPEFLSSLGIVQMEIDLFGRILKGDIHQLSDQEIQSSGYVVHTLEASIWCLLTTTNYQEAVLQAVNLGNDTDTTASVTGGLAGLLYGIQSIPEHWLTQLARKEDIENLAERLALKISER